MKAKRKKIPSLPIKGNEEQLMKIKAREKYLKMLKAKSYHLAPSVFVDKLLDMCGSSFDWGFETAMEYNRNKK